MPKWIMHSSDCSKPTRRVLYTFILEASREVPRRLLHAKRSTVGLRVPAHTVTQALLEALNAPLLSMTLQLPDDEAPLNIAWEIREQLEHQWIW